jgi:hypothetical protein
MHTLSPFKVRADAAAYLSHKLGRRISVSALARLASEGGGPRYCLILGRASYLPEWLDAWVEQQTRPPAGRQPHDSLTPNDDDEGGAAPAAA